jgi:hypothetical protein
VRDCAGGRSGATNAHDAKRLAFAIPPEVWATAQRLRKLGYDRHEVLHMFGGAMSGDVWEALQGRSGYDDAAHVGEFPAARWARNMAHTYNERLELSGGARPAGRSSRG